MAGLCSKVSLPTALLAGFGLHFVRKFAEILNYSDPSPAACRLRVPCNETRSPPTPHPAFDLQAPAVFSNHRFQRFFVQAEIGDHVLQPAVSSSSSFKRRASFTSMPPYLLFHM